MSRDDPQDPQPGPATVIAPGVTYLGDPKDLPEELGGAPSPVGGRRMGRRSGSSRVLRPVLALVAGVTGMVLVIGLFGDAGVGPPMAAVGVPTISPGPARPAPSSKLTGGPGAGATSLAQEQEDWTAILAELDSRRSIALTSLSTSRLADAVMRDSPAWAVDTSLIEQLQRLGLRPGALRTEVLSVRIVRADPRTDVELLVTDARAGYQLIDEAGAVVQRVPPAPKGRWRVRLVRVKESRTEPGWRIREVVAVQ